MGKVILFSTAGNSLVTPSNGQYCSIAAGTNSTNATETTRQFLSQIAGTFSKLGFRVGAVGTSRTLKFRKNAGTGSLSVSATDSSANEYNDTSNSDTIAANDKFNALWNAGTNGSYYGSRVLFEASDGSYTNFAFNVPNSTSTASVDRFFHVGGTNTPNGTESTWQSKIRGAGTWKHLFANVTAARATDCTVRSRINSGDGNQTFTLTGGATGFFQDTTHSDTLADGDLITIKVTSGTGTDTLTVAFGSAIVGSSAKFDTFGGCTGTITRAASATTHYYAIGGPWTSTTGLTAESTITWTPQMPVIVSNLRINVTGNTYSASGTVTLRKNAGDTAVTFSITNGVTGWFEDTTHTVSYGATDTMSVSIVGGSSGSIDVRNTMATIQSSTQDLTPSLFNDGTDSFFTPTVAATYALTPSLYDDGTDTFYTHTISQSGGTQSLTPSLYSDDDTFFSPTVAATYALTPSLYDDGTDTFYSATVTYTYALTPSLYTDADTFYNPTVSSTYALTPSLYSDADTFYSATVTTTYALTPSLYSDSDTFYSSTVSATYALTPSLYDDSTDTFYAPTVAQGAITLTPSLYSDTDSFYAPTVTPGAVNLTPSLYSDGDSFYSPTVAATYALAPSLYSDGDTFFSATITTGAVGLTPSLYSDGDSFYSATITVGSVNLSASLYSDADTFYTPTVSFIIYPSLYTDADTFFSSTVAATYALTPALYSDADTFFTPAITVGAVNLTASLFTDDDTFPSALVYRIVKIAPDADATDGGWTNELDSDVDLYASIDEDSVDDADYIKSSDIPLNDICKIGLSNPSAGMTNPMTVAVRFKKTTTDTTLDLAIRLMEGTTQIAEWTYPDVSDTFTTVTNELTPTERLAISNFANLYIELEANAP